MNLSAPAPTPTDGGWQASLALEFERRGNRTVLTHRRQRGPLAVQRSFYPEGEPCHLYLLHPPGGVVGGDRLEIQAGVGSGAHALVTTPGAAKFYRSAGARAQQIQTLNVAAGGCLEWLPQENILFPGANARLATDVQLHGDARFVGWELHCLGRPANDEAFHTGHADFGLRLERDGRPLFCDRLTLTGGQDLGRPTGLRGHPVCATLVATGAGPDAIPTARDAIDAATAEIGITGMDDILVARYLGDSTERARHCFVAIWQALRPLLLGREACVPRIWAT